MSAESMPAGSDPRQVLSEVRALTRRVRLDRRMTWVVLLVLAAVTLAGIPFDWFGTGVQCAADGSCEFARRGVLFYWPPALLLAYGAIAFLYVRAARARGLGARVLPYVITGALTTVVFTGAWLVVALDPGVLPGGPVPYWGLVLDRLIAPWGVVGIALLALAWLERSLAVLGFTVGYLVLVLLVLPMNFGFGPPHFSIRLGLALPQLIVGVVLLLAALAFRRTQR